MGSGLLCSAQCPWPWHLTSSCVGDRAGAREGSEPRVTGHCQGSLLSSCQGHGPFHCLLASLNPAWMAGPLTSSSPALPIPRSASHPSSSLAVLPALPFCNWERGRLARSWGLAPGSWGQAIVLRRQLVRESWCSRMNPAGAAISWCASSILKKKQTNKKESHKKTPHKQKFLNQLRLLRDNNVLYMVPY